MNRDVEVGEELRYTHGFIPRRSGSQRLVATFTSKELIDIGGSSVIEVDWGMNKCIIALLLYYYFSKDYTCEYFYVLLCIYIKYKIVK